MIDSTRGTTKRLVEERCSENRSSEIHAKSEYEALLVLLQRYASTVCPKSGFLQDFYEALQRFTYKPVESAWQLTASLRKPMAKPKANNNTYEENRLYKKKKIDCTKRSQLYERSTKQEWQVSTVRQQECRGWSCDK